MTNDYNSLYTTLCYSLHLEGVRRLAAVMSDDAVSGEITKELFLDSIMAACMTKLVTTREMAGAMECNPSMVDRWKKMAKEQFENPPMQNVTPPRLKSGPQGVLDDGRKRSRMLFKLAGLLAKKAMPN